MPPGGVEQQPHEAILRFEETLRVCRILAGLGIRRIKVTGGEPLVRKGVVSFICAVKALPGVEQVTVTTNGILLDKYLDEFAAIPLSGLNVSLDSLNPETFRRITREQAASAVSPAGIVKTMEQARSLGIPVKVNCVPLRPVNEGDLADIAALAEKTVDAVRFIELMPLGCAGEMEPVPGEEVRSILERCSLKRRSFRLRPIGERLGNGPAVYYAVPGFSGRIGFIDALSRGFCDTCNRLRLTPEGLLKPCLSSALALDLKTLLRSGASDSRIAEEVTKAAALKPARHTFSGVYRNRREDHKDTAMFRIGG
jgi:cyclic pyranopterin phosphate synthase